MVDSTHETPRRKGAPEPYHWAWSLIAVVLTVVFLARLGAWLAEALV